MAEQGYGRIVMTTSTGIFGLPDNLSYATAKARRDRADPEPGHGRRSPRHQGQPHRTGGLHADGGPAADGWTRAAVAAVADVTGLVAPMAAFLAHEDCPVTGEIYAAGAGRFARIFIASTPGYVHPAAADDRGRRPALGEDQRRTGVLRPGRPHGLVGRLHGASPALIDEGLDEVRAKGLCPCDTGANRG